MEGNVRTVWQPRPPDPDLEAEMLARLMMRFGVAEERARATVASAGAGQERASLGEKGRALTVNEPFDRSWRRVGLALDRIGFTVEDRNRAQGIYYVRYVNPDADSGTGGGPKSFFSKLFSGATIMTSRASTVSSSARLVRVLTSRSSTRMGAAEKSREATRILTLLYEQLK